MEKNDKDKYTKFTTHIIDYCQVNNIPAGDAYRYMVLMTTSMQSEYESNKQVPAEDSPECGA